MSPTSPPGRPGFRHEAALYSSDEQFSALAVPFLADGIAAGHPTLLAVPTHLQRSVQEALGDPDGLTLIPVEHCDQPFTVLDRTYRTFLDFLGARDRSTTQIRMIGAVPHADIGTGWGGWVRYEAAINDLFAPLPVWSICPYDIREVAVEVLDDVRCTHPYLATPDGAPRPNPRYTEPLAFLGERARHEVDPLESTRPDLALTDPAPAAGRRAVAAVGVGVGLNRETVDGLVIGVSEVLANAIRHGRPPVELRAWAGSDRVLVVVHDRGSGPSDPYAGYLPRRDEQAGSGLGLWITHQVCSQVTLIQSAGGFTVRLTAGAPYLPPPAPSDGRAS